MNHSPPQKIELHFSRGLYSNYCTFDSSNRFILYGNVYKHRKIEKTDSYIWIYSTGDENKKYSAERNLLEEFLQIKDHSSKSESELVGANSTSTQPKTIWPCKKLHKIPKNFDLISISKDNRLYLLSDNSIYEWSIDTGGMVGSIFANEEHKV